MHIIKDTELGLLLNNELKDIVSLSSGLAELSPQDIPPHMVSRIHFEASKLEELLDFFGASANRHWLPVRMSMAAAKAFSLIIYNLFHIQSSIDRYSLLPLEDNFSQATSDILLSLLSCYVSMAKSFIKIIRKMNLATEIKPLEDYSYRKLNFTGNLKDNRKHKKVENPEENVIYLATNFLKMAEESSWLNIHRKISPDQYASSIPEPVSEEKLRYLANNFHNLQSLYDTHLSGSAIAEADSSLPVMRGHISVVYHLLDTAVTVAHFYERHAHREVGKWLNFPVSKKDLLGMIFGYFVSYSGKYLETGQKLCRDILKSYAITSKIKVPIPNYRGFHVRPSTLIAKISIHYGSDVQMILGKGTYDASLPLELFRANEELNRRKRDAVACYVMENKIIKTDAGACYDEALLKKILRVVFMDLMEKQKIMIYNNDFSFEDLHPYENETLAEFIKRAIALYLAMGKIDIISNETVTFKGDKRVLEDIRILAENGYGEDKFGNNIVLPKELSYLKR